MKQFKSAPTHPYWLVLRGVTDKDLDSNQLAVAMADTTIPAG